MIKISTNEGILGFRERFIEAEEGTYGNAASLASANMPGYNLRVAPNFNQNFQEVLNSGADDRKIVKKVAGPLGLQYRLTYSPINWRRLKYVFDIDSETGSDPYTHTLSVGRTLKSYTAEWALRHDSNPIIIKTTGNVVNSTTIEFRKATSEGREGFVNIIQDCIAQDYTTPSLQAGDFSISGDPFQYRHMQWTLEGSEVVEVNNGSIVIEQGINLNDSRYANSTLDRTIGTPIAQLFRISGRFNVNLFDDTYTSLWKTAAALSGTNTLVFEQSASNKITFTFSGMTVSPVPLSETNLEGINSADFVFTATDVSVTCVDSIENW